MLAANGWSFLSFEKKKKEMNIPFFQRDDAQKQAEFNKEGRLEHCKL